MSRYIDADEIKYERATVDTKHGYVEACVAYRSDIQIIPTADVRENVKGKWIHEYDHEVEEVKFYPPGEGRFYAHCSNCGYYAEYEHDMTNYCPNCGADMRGGDAE